ncbi:MAG: hypothetical protein K9N21_17120 [Deltaproteobacteria bacterium]|nr:hypothetical protein [Deltaproteobacteria bacterium]
MAGPELFQVFIRPLNLLNIPYMVTGSVASIVYGEARMTHDIDMVVMIRVRDAERIAEAFPSTDFYCPPKEIIRIEANRPLRGHFNLIHHATGFKAVIYVAGEDPLHHWAMERRRCIRMAEDLMWVAPPEYVILRKLAYYREGGSEKHLSDIRGILEVSGNDLDISEIQRRALDMGFQKEWRELLANLPEGVKA